MTICVYIGNERNISNNNYQPVQPAVRAFVVDSFEELIGGSVPLSPIQSLFSPDGSRFFENPNPFVEAVTTANHAANSSAAGWSDCTSLRVPVTTGFSGCKTAGSSLRCAITCLSVGGFRFQPIFRWETRFRFWLARLHPVRRDVANEYQVLKPATPRTHCSKGLDDPA